MDLDVDIDETSDVYVRRFKQDAPYSEFHGISKACYDRVVDRMAAKIGRYRHLLVQKDAIEDEEFDHVSFCKFDKKKFKKHCVDIGTDFAERSIEEESIQQRTERSTERSTEQRNSDFSSSESESSCESSCESESDEEEVELTRVRWEEIVDEVCEDYRRGFEEEDEKWDIESFVQELVDMIGTEADEYDELIQLIQDKYVEIETDDECIANNLESALKALFSSIMQIRNKY